MTTVGAQGHTTSRATTIHSSKTRGVTWSTNWQRRYDGHPLVETVDAFMYGFWGEGHTWPFENNPFPSFDIAQKTWVDMFDHQRDLWKKTPLVVNTQPDFSQVGNDALVDRAVRSFNWLRTDTVFIENTQIDEISNRPPWTGATLGVGCQTGPATAVDEPR